MTRNFGQTSLLAREQDSKDDKKLVRMATPNQHCGKAFESCWVYCKEPHTVTSLVKRGTRSEASESQMARGEEKVREGDKALRFFTEPARTYVRLSHIRARGPARSTKVQLWDTHLLDLV